MADLWFMAPPNYIQSFFDFLYLLLILLVALSLRVVNSSIETIYHFIFPHNNLLSFI